MAPDPVTDPPVTDPPADPPVTDPDLGEAGKKALENERKARRDAERRAKEREEELEQLRRSQMDEQERAVADARDEGKKEATAAVNTRLVSAEVRAAAAKKGLTDPADAVRLLDLDQFDVDDNGDVDASAIEAALTALVESKPYLTSGSATPPPPGIDQGARTPAPGQTDPEKLTDPKAVVEWARSVRGGG